MNKILGTANFRYQQEMNEMQPQTFVLQNMYKRTVDSYFKFKKICQNKKMINAHAV